MAVLVESYIPAAFIQLVLSSVVNYVEPTQKQAIKWRPNIKLDIVKISFEISLLNSLFLIKCLKTGFIFLTRKILMAMKIK